MDKVQRFQRIRRLYTRPGEIAYELMNVQFAHFTVPETWQPAVNAYGCESGLAICVDLAGVDKSDFDVQVEPRRLLIRGRRHPPEPAGAHGKPRQVLVMEIDYGPFERVIALPSEVDAERVSAEQSRGLLWIHLPFRTSS